MGDNLSFFEAEAKAREKGQTKAEALATGQGKGRPALETPTFNVTIRLTTEEHKKLKLLAVEQQTTVSAILRELIQKNL